MMCIRYYGPASVCQKRPISILNPLPTTATFANIKTNVNPRFSSFFLILFRLFYKYIIITISASMRTIVITSFFFFYILRKIRKNNIVFHQSRNFYDRIKIKINFIYHTNKSHSLKYIFWEIISLFY